MSTSRLVPFFTGLAVVFALLTAPQATAAETGAATAVVSGFYDSLLATMKDGPALKFAGRYKLLNPAMARIAGGAQWSTIKPEEQNRIIESFSRFSVASYAANFDSWSGERFELLKESPAAGDDGNIVVETRMVPETGEPVGFNYLLRPGANGLRIIDVLVHGTISELAGRRSEFASVLRRDGAKGLYEMLESRFNDLAAK